MSRVGIFLLVALCLGNRAKAQQQTSESWEREEKSDPLHKRDFTQFRLEGKYLVPPKRDPSVPPALVVRCKEGKHGYGSGYTNGKFVTGYLAVDAVLDFRQLGVHVEFRLDDGKLQTRYWSNSTDGAGAFFNDIDFNTLLYGHFMPHKENTNPPVRRIILGVPEYLGSQIQVEFDLPDPGEVAEVCGVIVHKK